MCSLSRRRLLWGRLISFLTRLPLLVRSDTRGNVRHVDIVTMWHNKLNVFEGQLDRAKETLARFVVRITYLLPLWLMVLDFSGMRTQVAATQKTCSKPRR